MLFTSFEFALFLPIVFAIYWLLRNRLFLQNLFVVAASYLFYGWWDWRLLLLIAFTTACSYFSGWAIGRQEAPASPAAKAVLWGNIAVNLLILMLFKYYDFFAQSFADAFLHGHAEPLLLHLVLPVGISFYTFQALSYSIDVYRRKLPPCRDFAAFAAYVSFFPQLVAGPIERAEALLPQFWQPRRFDYALAVDGLRQMLWGFFKKMVVADGCAVYADQIFGHPEWYNGSTLLLAALVFSVQIYGDFSGYSDIAIGCAKLFGIRLKRNFNVPYFSRDIAEFWRRWHISLTSWFRDYVYIPLGGSRVPKGRVVLNTFVIFLLSGLWHGANWTFVLWGLFHALLFLPLILLDRNRRYTDTVAAGRALPSWGEFGRMLATFLLAAMGWVVFRCDSIGDALYYFERMFGATLFAPIDKADSLVMWAIGLSVLVMTVVEWLNRDQEHEFRRLPRSRALRWLLYLLLCCSIGIYMVTSEMPFIYFQF